LPTKRLGPCKMVIHPPRRNPFKLLHKIGERYRRWNRYQGVDVVFDAVDGRATPLSSRMIPPM
jgi:hypothetical protein